MRLVRVKSLQPLRPRSPSVGDPLVVVTRVLLAKRACSPLGPDRTGRPRPNWISPKSCVAVGRAPAASTSTGGVFLHCTPAHTWQGGRPSLSCSSQLPGAPGSPAERRWCCRRPVAQRPRAVGPQHVALAPTAPPPVPHTHTGIFSTTHPATYQDLTGVQHCQKTLFLRI